ncbi:MAG: OmpA family protein, partial [Actinomycetota bacterium]
TVAPTTTTVAPTTTTVTPGPPILLPTRGSAVTISKNRVSVRVFFGLRSSVLTPQAKRTLAFAVSKIPKSGKLEIEIIGAVQKSANSKNIDPLGNQRAVSVKRYLLSLNIAGNFNIRGIGVVGGTPMARRADATITYS